MSTDTKTITPRRIFTKQERSQVQLQRAEGKPPVISGYGAVFFREGDPATEYRLWDDIVERIMPGAFDRALRECDCRALFNHDPNQVLGRQSAGTLRLSIDAVGLRYDIDQDDTNPGRDTAKFVERRDVTGSSFSFVPRDTSYREVDGVLYIERNDVDLWDTGPVTFPAYDATTAELRSSLADPDTAEVAKFRAKRDADKTPPADTDEKSDADRTAEAAAVQARQRERDRVNARALEMIAATQCEKPAPRASRSALEIGDRVKVKAGREHDAMTKDKEGTVEEISTPALAIKFDDMQGLHKWYVEDELEKL